MSSPLLALQFACGPGPRAPVAEYGQFHYPQRVTIRGYDGEAMEP